MCNLKHVSRLCCCFNIKEEKGKLLTISISNASVQARPHNDVVNCLHLFVTSRLGHRTSRRSQKLTHGERLVGNAEVPVSINIFSTD
jgi:hypothetical protein